MNTSLRNDEMPAPIRHVFQSCLPGAANAEEITALVKSIQNQVAPNFHFGDNLLTWGRNLSMFEDSSFVEAWRRNLASDSDSAVVWRRYILTCAAHHAVNLDGDFVECGVYKGTGIKTIVDYLGGVEFPRAFWGYDTFEYREQAGDHVFPANGLSLIHDVRKRFSDYKQVRIVHGRLPGVLAGQSPERISLLHIDLHHADSEIAALEALFDRVVPGGIVVLDDYECSGLFHSQHLAERRWFESRGYRVMPLPTGQGIVIKRQSGPCAMTAQLPDVAAPLLQDFFYPCAWGVADIEEIATAAKSIRNLVAPAFHIADNMIAWERNLSLQEDTPFITAWTENAKSPSDFAIVWRRYIVACAAYHAIHLDGDLVECGCYEGVGIKTVVDSLGGVGFPKTFWGYDMFEHREDSANPQMPAHGPNLVHDVRAKFGRYPQVRIIQGRIPDVLADESPERISLLHIDLNQVAAEIGALEVLFDRVVPSGVVILDDYEWNGYYRAQHVAERRWFEDRGYRVMPLPTGQGLVIKR